MEDDPRSRLTDDERADWLQLIRSGNVGARTFHLLLSRYGSAQAALAALPRLARSGGAKGAIEIYPRDAALREIEAATSRGVSMIAACEPEYPPALRTIDDAPPLLAARGNLDALQHPMVGVVGSRNASAAGLKMASRITYGLGQAGFIVVSGLARGIDAAAHRASLATGTVAVLAGGHEHVYPPEHADLLDSILSAGAAISEMPLAREPRGHDFPRRNRLISGIAMGVVVVEAAARSGSLITARFALEQGREVFAVPGSPLDPRAQGTNALLQQGATLVTQAADIVAVLEPIRGRMLPPLAQDDEGPGLSEPDPVAAADTQARILALLGPTPMPIDDLVRLAAASPSLVRSTLLELELAGRLERHGGGLVSAAP